MVHNCDALATATATAVSCHEKHFLEMCTWKSLVFQDFILKEI